MPLETGNTDTTPCGQSIYGGCPGAACRRRCSSRAFAEADRAIAMSASLERWPTSRIVLAFLAPGLLIWAGIGAHAFIDQAATNIRATIVAQQSQ